MTEKDSFLGPAMTREEAEAWLGRPLTDRPTRCMYCDAGYTPVYQRIPGNGPAVFAWTHDAGQGQLNGCPKADAEEPKPPERP